MYPGIKDGSPQADVIMIHHTSWSACRRAFENIQSLLLILDKNPQAAAILREAVMASSEAVSSACKLTEADPDTTEAGTERGRSTAGTLSESEAAVDRAKLALTDREQGWMLAAVMTGHNTRWLDHGAAQGCGGSCCHLTAPGWQV